MADNKLLGYDRKIYGRGLLFIVLSLVLDSGKWNQRHVARIYNDKRLPDSDPAFLNGAMGTSATGMPEITFKAVLSCLCSINVSTAGRVAD